MWYFVALLVACLASLFVAGCTAVLSRGSATDLDAYVTFGAFILALVLAYGAARQLARITKHH